MLLIVVHNVRIMFSVEGRDVGCIKTEPALDLMDDEEGVEGV